MRGSEVKFKYMEDYRELQVISADRLNGSVIITLNNGRCAIYSAALLYATLSQAEEFYDSAVVEKQVKSMICARW